MGLRRREENGWEPLIVETEAVKGRGIEDLYRHIQQHREYLLANPEQLHEVLWKRARNQLVETLKDQALRTIMQRLEHQGVSLDSLIQKILNKEADPYSLVHDILEAELCVPYDFASRTQANASLIRMKDFLVAPAVRVELLGLAAVQPDQLFPVHAQPGLLC